MENLALDSLSTQCGLCAKSVSAEIAVCDTCGYPLHGTEMEQQTFLTLRSNKEIDLEEHDKKIRTSGLYLKVIGGISLVMGLVGCFTASDQEEGQAVLIVNIILAVIYFSLGFWSKYKPMTAIITGFIVFVLVILLNMLDEPASVLKGAILKIFVISAFIKGIISVSEANKIKKELEY